MLGNEPTSVIFQDTLVPATGVAAIGLQSLKNRASQWSLTPSRLQYYGRPVQVESTRDSSRVTMDQLHIISLGGVLRQWKLTRSDQELAA